MSGVLCFYVAGGGGGIAEELNNFILVLLVKELDRRNCRGIEIFKYN